MESTTETPTQAVPQSAAKLIEQVRRKTRRKFTAEEKIRIVMEGMKREISVSDLCRVKASPARYITAGLRISWRLANPDLKATACAKPTVTMSAHCAGRTSV